MGVLAYLFHFPPEQMARFDADDFLFWREQSEKMVAALNKMGQ
jgi:hypothetical protein